MQQHVGEGLLTDKEDSAEDCGRWPPREQGSGHLSGPEDERKPYPHHSCGDEPNCCTEQNKGEGACTGKKQNTVQHTQHRR